MKITLLGTGSAYRTPAAGGNWGRCDPSNVKNRRLCQSLLIEKEGKRLLVDAGPDIRQQTIDYQVTDLDAVLLTHAHYDHYFGLPEMEIFSLLHKKSIPVYAHDTTWRDIKPVIQWLLNDQSPEVSIITAKRIDYLDRVTIAGMDILPFRQIHGKIDSTGIRIGNFAYCTDLNDMPEESWEALKGIDTWILECDSIEPSYQHNNLKTALEWIEKINPQKAYLTHIHPYVDHNELSNMLPSHVDVAFDGMTIELKNQVYKV